MLRFPALLLALFLLGAAGAPAQTLEEEINLAIDRGVARLLTLQRSDGSFNVTWPDNGAWLTEYPIGSTSLVLYALVKSGLPVDDPVVGRAVEFLKYREFKTTYGTGLLILALDSLGGSEHDEWIRRAAKWLEERINPKFDIWGYPDGLPDFSNTQYAVLGLWTAEKHGYEVKLKTWQRLADATMEAQQPDGGVWYRYNLFNYSSGTTTTAGITILELVIDRLGGKPPTKAARASIDKAWAWMDRVFTTTGNPHLANGRIRDKYDAYGTAHYAHYYYLYGLERVCALSKRDKVGGRDWYREGAVYLLGKEDILEKKGEKKYTGDWGGTVNTAFTLLFLRRAMFTGMSGEHLRSDKFAAEVWQYTTTRPPEGWEKPDFDAKSWSRGPGAFGRPGGGNVPVRTEWVTPDIWVRRVFDWKDDPKKFRLFGFHDDGVEIWINGVKAVDKNDWTTTRIEFQINEAARAALRPAGNVIAAHCHDLGLGTQGGLGLDLSFDDVGESARRRGEKDADVRHRWWRIPPRDDVPFISNWLVLEPVTDPNNDLLNSDTAPVDKPPVDGQGWKNVKWRPQRARGGYLDLDATSRGKDAVLYHCFTWLKVAETCSVVLCVGADDGFKVYVDDDVVLCHNGPEGAKVDEWRIPLRLTEGLHRLMIKVEDETGPCGLFARIARRDGTPAPEVRAVLDPEKTDWTNLALTDPDAFTLTDLYAHLEVQKKRDLAFEDPGDLDLFAAPGGRAGWPRAFISHDRRASGPQPHPGQHGIVGMAPRSATMPARLVRKVTFDGGRPQLSVKYCGPCGVDPGRSGAILRIGVYDGELRWLSEVRVTGANDANSKAWSDLIADCGEQAGKTVLVVIECAAEKPEAVDAAVFIDRIDVVK